MSGLGELVSILILGIIFYFLGFRIVRRPGGERPDEREPETSPNSIVEPQVRRQILLDALDDSPYTEIISPRQRDRLRYSLMHPGETWTDPIPVDELEGSPVGPEVVEEAREADAFVPPPTLGQPAFEYTIESGPESVTSSIAPVVHSAEASGPPEPSRTPVIESIRASWDPAVMLLYVGALLVVVAGLIFATYNWGTLGGWQKLGILAAVTVAFLLGGVAIRSIERLKPASTTFIVIGGLLVPANFLAAYTVFDNVPPAMPLFLGAIATTVVHAVLSWQRGASLFRYSAVAAAIVAACSLPAVADFAAAWGGVLGLTLIAILPDSVVLPRRFQRPWSFVSSVAAGPIFVFAIWQGWESSGWIIFGALLAASMVATRFSLRYPLYRISLLILADGAAILSGISFAWILTDERWIIASALLGLSSVLLKRAHTWPWIGSVLHFAAAITSAALVADVVRELVDIEWGIVSGFAAVSATLLVHARRHDRAAALTEGLAAFTLPIAIVTGIYTYSESGWAFFFGTATLTATLILHRLRHRRPGDIMLALASISGIWAVLSAGALLDVDNASGLLIALGVATTAIANVLLSRFASISGWLKNFLRIEALVLFVLAGVFNDIDLALIYAVVILAMFWNVWCSRHSVWTIPMGFTIWIAVADDVMTSSTSDVASLWLHVALAAVFGLIAWQLDRRTRDVESRLHAGIYLWAQVVLVAFILVTATFAQVSSVDAGIHHGLTLLVLAGICWAGFRSTGGPLLLILAGCVALSGMVAFTFDTVSSTQKLILAAIVLLIAAVFYWRTSHAGSWIAFVLTLWGLVYLQMATGFSYTHDLVFGLVVAWVMVSVAIIRSRDPKTALISNSIFFQAMLLHPLALFLPLFDEATVETSRSDLVLALISLAGVVATFGALKRSWELVLVSSAIGMAALMLQISIGSPSNIHVYTVPLSVYLLGVGLMLRRDPRVANLLLAVGSATLVIPAMLEALTTGEITWLWISLAESIALFLIGAVLRLRIPTAAAVIAISVIALRMLVFAVSVLASWISILVIGVTLLLIGTMWLVFRDAIQGRLHSLYGRWRSFD